MKQFLLSVLTLLPAMLLAQDRPRVEVFGGYSFLHIDTQAVTGSSLDARCNRISTGFCPPGTFSVHPNAYGWNAATQVDLHHWFGIKADFAGHYLTPVTLSSAGQTFLTGLGVTGFPPHATSYTFLFGPVVHNSLQRYTIFGHALVGVDRFSIGTVTIPPVPPVLPGSTNVSISNIGLAVAFGGGVDVKVSDNISLRVGQVDYLYTQHNFNFIVRNVETHQNNIRASAGVVFVFGGERQRAVRSPRSSVVAPGATPISSIGVFVTTREANDGADILEIASGSIAAQAGLQMGDVLNQVDGKPVRTANELASELSAKAPGAKVRIGFLRRGYWQTEATLVLK